MSKVCIFTETYYPVVGGGETQARALADGLVAKGYQVLVLTRRSHASFKKIEQFGQVAVYRLPPVGGQHFKKWGLLFTGIPALIRLRRRYDLMFVSGFRVIGLPVVIVSKLLGKPCLLKADNNGEMSGSFFTAGMAKMDIKPNTALFRIFLRIRNSILRKATGFVAISTDIWNELISYGVAPSKVVMIPNSVDTNVFHPVCRETRESLREELALPLEDTIAAYTGRLVSYKGLPLLLQVWKRLKSEHSRIRLLLVGSGSLDIHNCEGELRDFVSSQGLQDSVVFTGEVRNVNQYLQASDIFVFPTKREAFGISLIEAMACGLPVISTSVGGVKDILQHRQNGFVVKPGDSQGLYDALDTLMADATLSARLGRAAWQTVQDRYSAETVTQQYTELFRRISTSRDESPTSVY